MEQISKIYNSKMLKTLKPQTNNDLHNNCYPKTHLPGLPRGIAFSPLNDPPCDTTDSVTSPFENRPLAFYLKGLSESWTVGYT